MAHPGQAVDPTLIQQFICYPDEAASDVRRDRQTRASSPENTFNTFGDNQTLYLGNTALDFLDFDEPHSSFNTLTDFDLSIASGPVSDVQASTLSDLWRDVPETATDRDFNDMVSYTTSNGSGRRNTTSTFSSPPVSNSAPLSSDALRHVLVDMRTTTPRSLPRCRSLYRLRRPTTRSSLTTNGSAEDSYDPLRRWQNSPPEDDPISLAAVERALQDAALGQTDRAVEVIYPAQRRSSRPASTTSAESAASSTSYGSSTSAASNKSARSQKVSKPSRIPRKSNKASTKAQPFKCTFCCDAFTKRYDWARHEKSLHLNLETWVCCPDGGSVYSEATGRHHCAYCNTLDPSPEHLQTHDHALCHSQTTPPRQFHRKDHLVQHLRLFHHLHTLPLIETWKTCSPAITSRCGFCSARLSDWDERTAHLSSHFRAGRTMKHWTGDHAFEPWVAAKVTNAIPPYLIANESNTILPFSCTNHAAKDQYAQLMSQVVASGQEGSQHVSTSCKGSYTEALFVHLSAHGREKMAAGVAPTDEMFQNEARRVLYGCHDPWNQTIADNPEWMSAFRLLHGWN